jgi:hypothetical protein
MRRSSILALVAGILLYGSAVAQTPPGNTSGQPVLGPSTGQAPPLPSGTVPPEIIAGEAPRGGTPTERIPAVPGGPESGGPAIVLPPGTATSPTTVPPRR